MKTKDWLYVVGILLIALAGCWFISQYRNTQGDNTPSVFNQTGNLVINNPGLQPNVWYLVYEGAGSPALSVKLTFTNDSECLRDGAKISCEFEAGQRAQVQGSKVGDVVTVQKLTVLDEAVKTRAIKLYYYNKIRDKELGGSGGVACSRDAVLPVDREIPFTITPIQDAIRELIKGEITSAEKAQGFESEFPHSGFELKGANLKDGILTLEFTEVPGFTTGGSCRVTILASQITKTAQQFAGVTEVRFKPDSLFQP